MNINHALLPDVRKATLPEKYEAAKLALVECHRIDECKDWGDKAAALASYAKQSDDKTMEQTAMRIRARAIRRCGELLKEFEATAGVRRAGRGSAAGTTSARKKAGDEAGLTEEQRKDALRVANVPEEDFERQVESDDPPTISALAEQGKKPAKGVPIYEQQGMTKEEFQAGMYFRGAMVRYVEFTEKYDPKDIVAGSMPDERQQILSNLKQIDSYHKHLRELL
jgi:hypothetical protein